MRGRKSHAQNFTYINHTFCRIYKITHILLDLLFTMGKFLHLETFYPLNKTKKGVQRLFFNNLCSLQMREKIVGHLGLISLTVIG